MASRVGKILIGSFLVLGYSAIKDLERMSLLEFEVKCLSRKNKFLKKGVFGVDPVSHTTGDAAKQDAKSPAP